MSNPLDPTALLALLPTLLPRSTSSPLPHPTDAVAALVHSIHISLDFRVTTAPTISQPRFTSDQHIDTAASAQTDVDDGASDTATAVDQEEDAASVAGQLPPGWNGRGEDSYSFEYRHAQSSMVFRVRVGRMGGRVQVDAMAENGPPNSLSIVLADIVTPPAFPIPSSATSSGQSSSSPEAPAKSLGFKSTESVKTFVEQYKRHICAKLLPGLQREGYTEPTTASGGSDPRNPPPSQPRHEPPPARPDPLMDPLHPGRFGGTPNPASVGHRDLDPLASLRPPGSFNPHGDGGGMYMDFNHPLFDSRRRGNPDLEGPGGSIQPPGARWDPIGPGAGGGPRFPTAGGNPMAGTGVGDLGWGDEMPPPGEFGPDLGRMGVGGAFGRGRGRGGGTGGRFGGPGGLGGLGGSAGGRGGGGMFM